MRFALSFLMLTALPSVGLAQSRAPDLTGTWEAESPDGPVTIILESPNQGIS